ncbi:hypothetical protein AX16_003841 [Volvariella volvacea WC 439]|nr:hypothetical protein AX16_003841 [Volvariella volvacea WC 439]
MWCIFPSEPKDTCHYVSSSSVNTPPTTDILNTRSSASSANANKRFDFFKRARFYNYGNVINSVAPQVAMKTTPTWSKVVARELLRALVVVDATHTGKVRADPLRCHPDTRQAIIGDIISWIEDVLRKKNILWPLGPVGIGKSAIATSVAKRLEKDGSKAKVAGSFFFFKNDPQRNSLLRLIPTLAYQLAVRFKDVGRIIDGVIAKDPNVLKAAPEVQWNRLIVEPVKAAPILPPAAIIIDGLDECGTARDQRQILELVSSCGSNFPLAFLVVSRLESHIINYFDAEPLLSICRPRIDLTNCKDSREMCLFIRSRFSEIFTRRHDILQYYAVNGIWPSHDTVDFITSKADGQFIYAATLLKFVDDEDTNPHDRLCAYISQDPEALSPLDALYYQILSASHQPDDKKLQSLLLLVSYLPAPKPQIPIPILWTSWEPLLLLRMLASVLYTDMAQCRLALKKLQSVLFIPPKDDGEIKVYHSSFVEFLGDPRRSGLYCISQSAYAIEMIERCVEMLRLSRTPNADLGYVPWIWWRLHQYLLDKRIRLPESFALRLKELDFVTCWEITMLQGSWIDTDRDLKSLRVACKQYVSKYLRLTALFTKHDANRMTLR